MRCFLAIPLPEDMAGQIRQALNRISPLSGLKPVPVENYHLTLDFYGSVESNRLTKLISNLANILQTQLPIHVVLNGITVLPNLKHPHNLVIQAAADSDRLAELHQTLVRTADLTLVRQPESRRFKPHVNLGRWSTPPHSRHDIRAKLHQFKMKRPSSFIVASVTLFESQLLPVAARYRPIEVFSLPI